MMRRSLPYETWKELLRNDCIAYDKAEAFNSLGEMILRILYNNGIDPTVEAIVRDGLNGRPTQERATGS